MWGLEEAWGRGHGNDLGNLVALGPVLRKLHKPKQNRNTNIYRSSQWWEGPSPVWSSSKSCLVGARVLLQILSSRGHVIFLARLPGSPPPSGTRLR